MLSSCDRVIGTKLLQLITRKNAVLTASLSLPKPQVWTPIVDYFFQNIGTVISHNYLTQLGQGVYKRLNFYDNIQSTNNLQLTCKIKIFLRITQGSSKLFCYESRPYIAFTLSSNIGYLNLGIIQTHVSNLTRPHIWSFATTIMNTHRLP